MATFRAKGTFRLERNGLRTVIYGDIVEGAIERGMKVHIPFNDSVSMVAEIEAVEIVTSRSRREEHVALVLRVEEDAGEEAELYDSLHIEDEILEVRSP